MVVAIIAVVVVLIGLSKIHLYFIQIIVSIKCGHSKLTESRVIDTSLVISPFYKIRKFRIFNLDFRKTNK